MKKVLLFLCALTLVYYASPISAQAGKVLLKVPVAFGTHLPGLGTPIRKFEKWVNAAGGGSVKVKVYEPKKLVAPFEILGAVSSGKINAGYSTAGYWAGKIKAAPLFSAVPFGPGGGEYMAWLYFGNGRKLYQEMYDKHGFKVKVIPCAIIAPETSGWFSKPINSAADLKGLRMRFFGLGGKVMNKLGVSTSLLPGGEIFPALEKKAIDATEFSMPAIDERLGFYKIVKYNYFPGWHQQATVFELLINQSTWFGLSNSQKTLIEMACKATMAWSFAEGEGLQFAAMQRNNTPKRGVKTKYWSKKMLGTFRKAWNEVQKDMYAKDAFFRKVWDDFQKFHKGYQVWQSHAYLPLPKR